MPDGDAVQGFIRRYDTGQRLEAVTTVMGASGFDLRKEADGAGIKHVKACVREKLGKEALEEAVSNPL